MKRVNFTRIYFYLVININSQNVDDFSSEKLRKTSCKYNIKIGVEFHFKRSIIVQVIIRTQVIRLLHCNCRVESRLDCIRRA